MNKLRQSSNERINRVSLTFQREEINIIDWNVRLLGIKGAHGIGKTTLILQQIKLKESAQHTLSTKKLRN